MNIYIGYNFSKEPIGVLLATSLEKAHIAWAGMSCAPYTVEVITQEQINNNTLGVYGVVFLLTSTIESIYINNKDREFIVFKRGI